jgi:galactokinase
VQNSASHSGRQPALIARAPGRVNLLGEHVDYQEPVLPGCYDRAVTIAVAPTTDEIVRLSALDLREGTAFALYQLEGKTDLDGNPLPRWALYPAGVAWALRRAGLAVRGLEAVYTSDVPIGAGLRLFCRGGGGLCCALAGAGRLGDGPDDPGAPLPAG